MSKRVAIVVRLVMAAALVQTGCRKHVRPRAQPPTSCSSQQQGSNLVVAASAHTQVGRNWFTVDVTSSINTKERPDIGSTEAHLLVQRNSSPAIWTQTKISPKGAVEVRVVLGEGFHGIKEVVLATKDHKTLEGTIDGRPIAPFPVHGKPESIKFADGSTVKTVSIDDDLKQALPVLMKSIQQQCPSNPIQKLLPQAPSTGGGSDPPAHYSYPDQSVGCIACIQADGAALSVCIIAAAAAATACLIYYPICLAAGLASCAIIFAVTLQSGCHLASAGGAGGGGPCCPIGCGYQDHCCEVGETCVGPKGMCCSPGLKGCSTNYCCGPSDACLPNAPGIPPFPPNLCCPPNRNVCNGVCCQHDNDICNPQTQLCCPQGSVCGNSCCDGVDQVCVNSGSSTCCARAHACGTSCCAKSESCTEPSHGTCTACSNCSSEGAECCFGKCCLAPDYCDADSRSCKCPPNCAGKCGGAPDGCGGTCDGGCGEFDVCYQQACCQPNCSGKCGGASDGCGGTCTTCLPGQLCQGQVCCSPDCTNKSCGAGDGCGGKCDGFCPPSNSCTPAHVCKPNCGGGKTDCCGDGSCCLTGSQCFKCSCGASLKTGDAHAR